MAPPTVSGPPTKWPESREGGRVVAPARATAVAPSARFVANSDGFRVVQGSDPLPPGQIVPGRLPQGSDRMMSS